MIQIQIKSVIMKKDSENSLKNSSAFRKKKDAHESQPSFNERMNLLLGLGSDNHLKGKITKDLILACAMFWDSKKRVDRIKSLMLKDQQLEQFEDCEDFHIDQLLSIELLSLSKNKITHLHPISNLDTLVCLNVNFNRVYDLSPLSTLPKLEQLYASHNQISNVAPLGLIETLRIINLYQNKINQLQQALKTFQGLSSLQELDIEENPVYGKQSRCIFLRLNIVRLNGEIILEEERGKNLPISASSMVLGPKYGTGSSFFKTAATETLKRQNLIDKIDNLETELGLIDQKYQQQIVKNVQLKKEYEAKIQKKKIQQKERQTTKQRNEEIRDLKRKLKTLKENLFTKDQKGELLREIFNLENKQIPCEKKEIPTNINLRYKQFTRKFDYDEEIVIGNRNIENIQIQNLLQSNISAIQQLKRQLREINR